MAFPADIVLLNRRFTSVQLNAFWLIAERDRPFYLEEPLGILWLEALLESSGQPVDFRYLCRRCCKMNERVA